MDYREIITHFNQVNKDISGMNKAIKQQQKEDKQKFNDSTLTLLKLMSEEMQSHNASEQSIQLAVKGTYEFYKVLAKVQLPQSSINSLLHQENQAQQSTSSFGTPLSEIKTQHITWLWENRIPQGKITLLEGDPGMGKSLLALDIAAHVSTGRPMPGDTTGKIGSVILIAPEDGAADTIKPRVASAGGDLSRIHLLNTVESLDVNDIKKLKLYQKPFSLAKNLFDLEQTIIQTKGINLSFPRQEIIKALQSSRSTLDLKEIAEKIGLNYKSLRMTVSRMHEAGLIAHPFRGKYTTLEQDAASKKRMEEEQKARELQYEAFRKRFAPDATVTTDANSKASPKESAH